jgi:hypothetical protein
MTSPSCKVPATIGYKNMHEQCAASIAVHSKMQPPNSISRSPKLRSASLSLGASSKRVRGTLPFCKLQGRKPLVISVSTSRSPSSSMRVVCQVLGTTRGCAALVYESHQEVKFLLSATSKQARQYTAIMIGSWQILAGILDL